MKTRRDVYQAIADPTRRSILGLLAHKSLNLNDLAKNFQMSRQAVSLHIKILEECQLVKIEKKGRERICHAQLESLDEVSQWMSHLKTFWTKKLLVLKQVVEDKAQTSANDQRVSSILKKRKLND